MDSTEVPQGTGLATLEMLDSMYKTQSLENLKVSRKYRGEINIVSIGGIVLSVVSDRIAKNVRVSNPFCSITIKLSRTDRLRRLEKTL